MTTELSLKEIQKEWHGTYKSYIMGFIVCLLLTGASFFLVYTKLLSGYAFIYTIIGLAFVQAIVQVIFFLHVGQEAKPRWETISFCLMVMFLLILVIGSLWVMNDLNERVMPDMTNIQSKEMFHHD
jgi:cytochrome o ubiquinol oxidase operon protein cyoD